VVPGALSAAFGGRNGGTMAEHSFQTALDADQYFQGLARQEMDFHQAIGELIDNALSARLAVPHGGEGKVPAVIEITLEQSADEGSVNVQIADPGLGMTLAEIQENVFNPGGQGKSHGSLNEHGFGLKNALALLTAGNATGFDLYTRPSDGSIPQDTFLHVTGPLGTTMKVRDDATREDWAKNLTHLADAEHGTKVRCTVQMRYLRTVYRRGRAGFDKLVERLGEHLGVMHRYFISEGNEIQFSYRTSGNEWTYQTVPAIPIPYQGETKEISFSINVAGEEDQVQYVRGELGDDHKNKELASVLGWPYPLQIYYQFSNARCGIDITVRDRVIRSGVFEDIWPEISKTVAYNRFAGELQVGSRFRTTNNKTGLDPHGENWEELLRLLGEEEEFRPEETTRTQSEHTIREKLVTILKGTFTGAHVGKNRSTWGGAVDIDIFVDAGKDNVRLYELKAGAGKMLDLYQLLMGWDGLVAEGVSPTVGLLICKSISPNLDKGAEAANKRADASGSPYRVEIKRIDEVIP
jgi:Histidine kinase-, DNA gyrase B-, and HSP90-like ATPase